MFFLLKPYFILAFLLALTFQAKAQTTYLPLGTLEYHLLDRLETLSGHLQNDFSITLKPIARKEAVAYLNNQKTATKYRPTNFSYTDLYNIQRALSISGEWTVTDEGDDGTLYSRKPILKYFYKRQPDFLHFNTGDLFLVVNPVLYTEVFAESNQKKLSYINTRGVEIRGRILNKIGFYTMLADNQERMVSYMQSWAAAHQAFPSGDYYHNNKGVNDVFLANGYFDFGLFRNHVNVTFGYDRNFIGDGMRSLFLSNVGAAATFLRLRSKIGKLNYENLFLELTNDYTKGTDRRLDKKYAAIHQLNRNVAQWLNIGIFERTVFAPQNKLQLDYFLPIIGYNTLARALGTDRKTALGLNFKAIAMNRLQFYGQAFADRINIKAKGSNTWQNQYGVQLGVQYFDVFAISNLDLRAEANLVRPFAYSSNDSTSNYTHYNQALAHPFESSFAEGILLLHYQPIPKLRIDAKGVFAVRGSDTSTLENWGNDIFKNNSTRTIANQYPFISGSKLQSLYLNLNINYEIVPNLFIEAGGSTLQRQYKSGIKIPTSTYFYGGIRWNIARKEYDYF